jgi:hypothetical protein
MPAPDWEKLSPDARRVVQKAALFAPHKLPLAVLTTVEAANRVADELAGFPSTGAWKLEKTDHVWQGGSLTLSKKARPLLSALPELAEEEVRETVKAFSDFFFSFFVWPPPEMRMMAERLEPHLDRLIELAAGLGLHEAAARVAQRRALFVTWGRKNAELGLRHTTLALEELRRTEPHPGTLAMLLTQKAHFEGETGRLREALAGCREAESLLIPLVEKASIEPFLLYCQLASIHRALGDPAEEKGCKEEAERIVNAMADKAGKPRGSDEFARLRKHIEGTLCWAMWHFQRYLGM